MNTVNLLSSLLHCSEALYTEELMSCVGKSYIALARFTTAIGERSSRIQATTIFVELSTSISNNGPHFRSYQYRVIFK